MCERACPGAQVIQALIQAQGAMRAAGMQEADAALLRLVEVTLSTHFAKCEYLVDLAQVGILAIADGKEGAARRMWDGLGKLENERPWSQLISADELWPLASSPA